METSSALNLLQSSHAFAKIKNDTRIYYPHPNDIISLFNNPNVTLGNAISMHENNVTNTAFMGYMVTEYTGREFNGHRENFGVVVDVNKNSIVIFTGYEATACLNLCTFGAVDTKINIMQVDDLEDKKDELFQTLHKQEEIFKRTYERLNQTEYNDTQYFQRLGELAPKIEERKLWPFFEHSVAQSIAADSIYKDDKKTDWKILSTMTDLVKTKQVLRQLQYTNELQSLFV